MRISAVFLALATSGSLALGDGWHAALAQLPSAQDAPAAPLSAAPKTPPAQAPAPPAPPPIPPAAPKPPEAAPQPTPAPAPPQVKDEAPPVTTRRVTEVTRYFDEVVPTQRVTTTTTSRDVPVPTQTPSPFAYQTVAQPMAFASPVATAPAVATQMVLQQPGFFSAAVGRFGQTLATVGQPYYVVAPAAQPALAQTAYMIAQPAPQMFVTPPTSVGVVAPTVTPTFVGPSPQGVGVIAQPHCRGPITRSIQAAGAAIGTWWR